MKGLGTDEGVLTEVLCTRTQAEIKEVSASYKLQFKRNLIDDVEDDTSGHLQKVYSTLITAAVRGYADAHVPTSAEIDEFVEDLYKAGEGQWGSNDNVFIRFLCENPRDVGEQVYWKYAQKYGTCAHSTKHTRRCVVFYATPPCLSLQFPLLGIVVTRS